MFEHFYWKSFKTVLSTFRQNLWHYQEKLNLNKKFFEVKFRERLIVFNSSCFNFQKNTKNSFIKQICQKYKKKHNLVIIWVKYWVEPKEMRNFLNNFLNILFKIQYSFLNNISAIRVFDVSPTSWFMQNAIRI